MCVNVKRFDIIWIHRSRSNIIFDLKISLPFSWFSLEFYSILRAANEGYFERSDVDEVDDNDKFALEQPT